MKKRFRFTLELEADINEPACTDGKTGVFLREFLGDRQAFLERCKVFLLCELAADTYIADIQKSLGISDPLNDDYIYTSVLEKCPAGVRDHFTALFDSGRAWDSPEFEQFLDSLGGLKFRDARLEEIDE